MLDIIHKKVKLDIEQIYIDKSCRTSNNQRENESQSTKLYQDIINDLPITGECDQSFPLDQEIIQLLKYSQYYGMQILSKFVDSSILIEKLRLKQLQLKKELMIYFLQNVRSQSPILHDLIYLEAANLDKDIRQAAIECMSRFKVIDDQEILNLIRKPKDSLELLQNHSKGLLISILEDQYYIIRINAIRAIMNFNKQSTIFANHVLEILINMLNDESDLVRIEAIQVLLNYPKIEFNRGDSNAIKFNLNEQNFKLRKAIYDLIGQSIFPETLHDIFESICFNLTKFPQDFIYISNSVRQLALKNPNILSISEIIKKERLTQEPNIYSESQEYIVRMIYAYYTTRKDTDPFYFSKHFAYFSDKYPDLFQSNKVTPDEFYAFKLYNEYQQLMKEVFNSLKIYRLQECKQIYSELCAKYEFDQSIIPPPPLEYNHEFRIPNWEITKFQSRSFKFILPLEGTNFRVYPEFPLTFVIQGEFRNLKMPISKNYAIQLLFMDGTSELNKISQIEDNIIKANLEMQRKVQDFSQPAKILFVQLVDGLQLGNPINIYLQI
ncbi:unnamed protein product [Paramecium pentaurelia]|uniref:Uncharacterized protein n=1 Tax=Paramecium pentaurelia TaxID=43138 RepID=A0A8S1T1R1_9CILI|nr:unnamed protein product [Paramecium pentaurelia]